MPTPPGKYRAGMLIFQLNVTAVPRPGTIRLSLTVQRSVVFVPATMLGLSTAANGSNFITLPPRGASVLDT